MKNDRNLYPLICLSPIEMHLVRLVAFSDLRYRMSAYLLSSSLTDPLTYSPTLPTHPLIHLPTNQTLPYSPIHSLLSTHSLTHPLTHSPTHLPPTYPPRRHPTNQTHRPRHRRPCTPHRLPPFPHLSSPLFPPLPIHTPRSPLPYDTMPPAPPSSLRHDTPPFSSFTAFEKICSVAWGQCKGKGKGKGRKREGGCVW